MSATDVTLLLVLPGLLLASAFFSGSETALFGLSEHERAALASRSPLSGRAASALLHQPRMLLITILLGNMVVNVLFFVIASVLTLRADDVILKTVFSVAPLLAVILFGEVTPKLVATGRRVSWCAVFAPPLLALHRIIAPIRLALNALVVEPAARLAGAQEPVALSADDLGELLEISAREGEIDPVEAELLDDVVELSSLRISDIMTPRVEVSWIRAAASQADIEALARSSTFTRIPVCRDSLDDGVIGVLDLRVYLAAHPDARKSVEDVMLSPLYMPEQARLDQLLSQLQRRNHLMAVAVDEYGAVAGVVTFGDVARRMGQGLSDNQSGFGDGAGHSFEQIGPGAWRVAGRLSVHDLVEAFGPTDRPVAGAVAGLINAELGRIAEVGDVVRVGNVSLTVESMKGRAIESVIVSADASSPGDRP